jgi:hypothetical protein
MVAPFHIYSLPFFCFQFCFQSEFLAYQLHLLIEIFFLNFIILIVARCRNRVVIYDFRILSLRPIKLLQLRSFGDREEFECQPFQSPPPSSPLFKSNSRGAFIFDTTPRPLVRTKVATNKLMTTSTMLM